MKKLAFVLIPVAILAALFWFLRTPDTDPDAMKAKYGAPPSAFADNGAGLKVHYRDQGNPDGIPIVLLHGSAASLHTWEPLVKELGGKYRIITYTQPGHGLTGPHPRDDYTYAGMVEALDLIIETLDLDHFVLGGNSMGGWLSWRYAIEHPEKIDALLLFDAAGAPLREGEEEPPSNLGFRIIQNPAGRFLLQHITPRPLVEKSVLQTVENKSIVTDAMVDRYWELLRLPGNRRAAGFRALADREPDMFARIPEITAPVLVIWGAQDQLIDVSAAQTFEERLPHAEVVIYDDAGHLPMEEAPERAARDIDAFLGRELANANAIND